MILNPAIGNIGPGVGVGVGVGDGVTVGVGVGVGSVTPTATSSVVDEDPLGLPTVCMTVYNLALGYVWAGFFVVAFGVLSPKLYCHQVAPVLVSVTYILSGGCPLCGVILNPAWGKPEDDGDGEDEVDSESEVNGALLGISPFTSTVLRSK